jgi:hypothetical protein
MTLTLSHQIRMKFISSYRVPNERWAKTLDGVHIFNVEVAEVELDVTLGDHPFQFNLKFTAFFVGEDVIVTIFSPRTCWTHGLQIFANVGAVLRVKMDQLCHIKVGNFETPIAFMFTTDSKSFPADLPHPVHVKTGILNAELARLELLKLGFLDFQASRIVKVLAEDTNSAGDVDVALPTFNGEFTDLTDLQSMPQTPGDCFVMAVQHLPALCGGLQLNMLSRLIDMLSYEVLNLPGQMLVNAIADLGLGKPAATDAERAIKFLQADPWLAIKKLQPLLVELAKEVPNLEHFIWPRDPLNFDAMAHPFAYIHGLIIKHQKEEFIKACFQEEEQKSGAAAEPPAKRQRNV